MLDQAKTIEPLEPFLPTPSRSPRRDVIGEMLAEINRTTAKTTERVIQTGAERMLSQRWRITKAIYYGRNGWPLRDKPLKTMLADCRERIVLERERASHWSHDFNRLIELRQAERALLVMLEGDSGLGG